MLSPNRIVCVLRQDSCLGTNDARGAACLHVLEVHEETLLQLVAEAELGTQMAPSLCIYPLFGNTLHETHPTSSLAEARKVIAAPIPLGPVVEKLRKETMRVEAKAAKQHTAVRVAT